MRRNFKQIQNMIRRLSLALLLCAMAGLGGCGEPPAKPALPHDAKRIVSLSPNSTEILFALGVGDRVVGRTAYCKYPPEVRQITDIGTAPSGVNIETVLSLNPDLVIILGNDQVIEGKMAAAGVPMLHIYSDTMILLERSIREIATAVNHCTVGEIMIRNIHEDFSRARQLLEAQQIKDLRALMVVGRTPGTLQNLFAAGPTSSMGEMLRALGLRNALPAESKPWQEISKEDLIRLDPDLLFDFMGRLEGDPEGAAAAAKDWEPLSSMKALRDNRVKVITDQKYMIMGPRLGEAAMSLAEDVVRLMKSR